ncbi:CPBP family intramembrane glutamic endopeptidase [Actinoplanes sp. NPDC026670]|uniref:CPBP family intramembrane glutamic endopeptidase n=1 Tax=Actinoplanes sp. NPDC026670 TaxID=3154700 RepID=UPI0033C8D221
MADMDGMVGSGLIAGVFGVLLLSTVLGVIRRRQLLEAVARDRAKFFRNSILTMVGLVVNGLLAVAIHPDLTLGDVGWRAPEGNWQDYVYTGYFLVLLLAVYLRSRKGPLAASVEVLLPRTGRERWLAGGTAVAFGIGEEFLYRGLLLAVGTELLGLPLWVAAVGSWVLFLVAHVYQGGRALITVGLLGLLFTMIYVSSMSLVLPMLVHTLWDAVVFLLIRPRPTVETPMIETPMIETPMVETLVVEEPVETPLRLRAAAPD